MCVCRGGACLFTYHDTCGGQKTTPRSQFSSAIWVLGIEPRSSDLVTSTDALFCQLLLCLCKVCIIEVCKILLRSALKETLENVHSQLCGNLSTGVSRQFWALRWSSLHTCSCRLYARCHSSSTQFLRLRCLWFLSRLDFGWASRFSIENDVEWCSSLLLLSDFHRVQGTPAGAWSSALCDVYKHCYLLWETSLWSWFSWKTQVKGLERSKPILPIGGRFIAPVNRGISNEVLESLE